MANVAQPGLCKQLNGVGVTRVIIHITNVRARVNVCEQTVQNRSVVLTGVEPFTTYDVIVAAGSRDVISLPSVPAGITTLGK